MVVILHFPFNGVLGEVVAAISRIGVPFFFMVSGFFSQKEGCTPKELRKRSKRRITRYVILIIGINAVYLAQYVLKYVLGRITLGQLSDTFSALMTPEFIIGNVGFTGFVWFIRSLLYIEIVLLLFNKPIAKFIKSRVSTFVIIAIWILDILLMKYSNLIFGFVVPAPWAELLTKFIGTGWLYYLLGMKIKALEKEIREAAGNKKWLLYALLAIVFNIVEFLILDHFDVNQMPANYIFTLPSVLFIFVFLLTHRNLGENTIFCFIGTNLSMYIYYWHGLVGTLLLPMTSKIISLPDWFYANAFVVYIATLIFAIIIYSGKRIMLRHAALLKNQS